MDASVSDKAFLVFGAPQIEEAEIEEVIATLRSGWIGTGPRVAKFEREFAYYKRVGPDHVTAVNSCTAALHLSLVAAGIGPGDEVITTPLTFCATVNAIIHSGATPVLADVDCCSMNIDPREILARITPRTKAIVPVHFAGRPCDMAAILAIAERHELRVIEDCAHAIETEYDGIRAGTAGDFGCFSFYVTKNVATGEGGMIVARDPSVIERLRSLSLHGMTTDAWKRFGDGGYRHYQVMEPGFKYNMTDIQAAIGIHQLRRVEQNWRRRQLVWERYQEAFADLPVVRPDEAGLETRHAYHLYTLLIDGQDSGINRDEFLMAMNAQQVGVGVHYLSIPSHPYYQQRYGWQDHHYPHAARIGGRTVSIPLSARLTDAEVERVIAAVRRALT